MTTTNVRCHCCDLPSTTRHIALQPRPLQTTAAGLCSYCDFRGKMSIDFFDVARYRGHFEQRLERIRGKYPYDALVGLSGGKDGAYVLHRLTRDYGLKVLAYTFDNGFLSDPASDKIRELIDIYRVDHVFYRPVHLLELYRAIVRKAAVPCHACAMAGYYRALAIQLDMRIPLFVHGRSPYQMLRNLDADTFENDPYFVLTRSNLEPYDSVALRAAYTRLWGSIKQALAFLGLSDASRRGIEEEFFAPLGRISPEFVPESFAFFLTERYDETRIRSTLQNEVGYVAPASHDDCRIHNAANYLTAKTYGVSVQDMETATMRRFGHLPDEAVMGCEPADASVRGLDAPAIAAELALLCRVLGIEECEIAAWPSVASTGVAHEHDDLSLGTR